MNRHKRRTFLIISGLLLAAATSRPSFGQLDGVLQIESDVQRFLERQQVRGLLPDAHLSHLPISAISAQTYLDALAEGDSLLTDVDRTHLSWYRGAAPGPGTAAARRIGSFLYPDGHSLFAVLEDDYAIRVEPLLHASLGPGRQTARDGRDPSPFAWQYARGARASGRIGDRVYFEARLAENRERPIRSSFSDRTAARRGFVSQDGEALDYFSAAGVVGFQTTHFEARLGRDRNRWGVGRGSVLLSDFASPYDFLQLRTTLGRFQYVNLFAGLTEKSLAAVDPNLPDPRKYAAFHRLSVALPGRVQLGLFETVIFATDSLGARRGFDISYLNPVIFYRAVERDRGSPDNVLLGGDVAWVPAHGLRVYGQFILDELKVNRIGEGWWGNKWGWVLGTQTADLPLSDLSIRLEIARLRPFLYGHRTAATSFVHYNDVVGHPVGPNAWDAMLEATYYFSPRIRGALTLARTVRGRNPESENVGADPLVPYTTRTTDTGISLLDGVRQTEWLVESFVGYQLLPQLFIELALRAESLDDAETGIDRYVVPMLQARWGMPAESRRY